MTPLPDTLPDSRSDEALLAAFAGAGDQHAFAELARRHAGMVLAVCRSVLGPSSDADDASQAVFLTLAQKASSRHVRRHLVGWLHRVAWYVAARAAQARAIRRRHEQEAAKMRPENATVDEPAIPLDALHAGLAALPEKYRVPLLLHHLEGRTQEETAALLGCGASALAMRLHRGRQLLRAALAKKGLLASAPAVSAVLLAHPAAPAPPAFVALAAKTAAALFAHQLATVSSPATLALSKGAIHMLYWAKMKLVAPVAAALLLAGGALGLYVATTGAAPAPAIDSSPLWNGAETIAQYARRMNLPAAKTVTLAQAPDTIVMNFVLIPAGEFTMGSPVTEPERLPSETQHKVRITKPFLMQTTPVTQAQWKALMPASPARFQGANLPEDSVSWFQAVKFCDTLSNRDAAAYRLPTEAEWEFACRAGTTTPFSFGDSISPDDANYNGNVHYGNGAGSQFRVATTPVDTFKPNPWGLYDMHGNVWQWCGDWYAQYPDGDASDPAGPAQGAVRVVRGGSWADVPRFLRSACRETTPPDKAAIHIGFRVVLELGT